MNQNKINWKKLNPSPYSHTDPFAIFQHRSKSSLTFPNLRALFCPRCAFFCSFVIFPPRPPDPRASRESRASRCCPRSPVVEPSAASSSATVSGLATEIRNLGWTVRSFHCKYREPYSDFTGAVPAGYGEGRMVDSIDMMGNKNVFENSRMILSRRWHVIDATFKQGHTSRFNQIPWISNESYSNSSWWFLRTLFYNSWQTDRLICSNPNPWKEFRSHHHGQETLIFLASLVRMKERVAWEKHTNLCIFLTHSRRWKSSL